MPTLVHVSAHGNVFMREIAERLVEALRLSGHDSELVTDRLPVGEPRTNLVLAPHEFFPLFPCDEPARRQAAANATCINTEQPGTPFFELALRYAAETGRALDMNPVAARALQHHGIDTVHLPLGWVPSLECTDPPAERHVDVMLLAGRTERRERFVGGAASLLWEWRCDLRFFSWHRPATGDSPAFLVGDDKLRALAGARLLLNVHRDELPYFEWARVLEALANGCVVATEDSVDIAPLVPGEHLLMASFDQLAEAAVALLHEPDRLAAMSLAGRDLLRTELRQSDLLATALAELDGVPVRRPRRRVDIDVGELGGRARRLAGRARRALRPTTTATQIAEAEAEAATLKRAYLGQLRVLRGIERARAAVIHGDGDHVDLVRSGDHTTTPDISVVIPLFGQAHYITEALDSVLGAAAAPWAYEVIVVDDHSLDDGADIAATWLAEHPVLPGTLARRAANGGLPVARNTGFGLARGRYVMALDADNLMYPNGLRDLAATLDAAADDVVAVYGLLERFDTSGSLGLTSHLPWDPDLLVHGAYIDAMAMFHLDRWRTVVGGYADTPELHGWEDYDLWLTVAEQGHRAQLHPAIVGRYREQPGSMRRLSDIDMASNFNTLRQRHPRLPWP